MGDGVGYGFIRLHTASYGCIRLDTAVYGFIRLDTVFEDFMMVGCTDLWMYGLMDVRIDGGIDGWTD
jgi:hypothetical protein